MLRMGLEIRRCSSGSTLVDTNKIVEHGPWVRVRAVPTHHTGLLQATVGSHSGASLEVVHVVLGTSGHTIWMVESFSPPLPHPIVVVLCSIMAISDEQLAARLARHDEYFCEVVNLVPPHLYIPQDEPDPNVRYFKVCVRRRKDHLLPVLTYGVLYILQNKKLAAPLQQKKEESAKGKKVKFDPANMKSVTQVQKVR